MFKLFVYISITVRTSTDCFYCSVMFQRSRGLGFWKSIFPFRNVLISFWGDFGYQFLVKDPETRLGDLMEARNRMATVKKTDKITMSFPKFFLETFNSSTEYSDNNMRRYWESKASVYVFKVCPLMAWKKMKDLIFTEHISCTKCHVMFSKYITTMWNRYYCQILDKGSNPGEDEWLTLQPWDFLKSQCGFKALAIPSLHTTYMSITLVFGDRLSITGYDIGRGKQEI